jgi:hypothetical protein
MDVHPRAPAVSPKVAVPNTLDVLHLSLTCCALSLSVSLASCDACWAWLLTLSAASLARWLACGG